MVIITFEFACHHMGNSNYFMFNVLSRHDKDVGRYSLQIFCTLYFL